MSGCSTLGTSVADLALTGAGGVAGYHLSDHQGVGAAAGAALGYVGSRVAQSEMQREIRDAEKRGYDRALNQAVKQQYWAIQNQQRSRPDAVNPRDPRLVPVVIPETRINGVLRNAYVEYLPVGP